MKKYIIVGVIVSVFFFTNTSVANYGCTVDLVANTNTCLGIIPVTVIAQENQQALVKINLAPDVALPGARVRFDVSFRNDISPDGWNVDIGDSDTNDGYAGDGSTSANDAEMQILSNREQAVYDFGIFGNDQTPASHTTDGHRFLKNIFHKPLLTGKTVSFIVGDEYLKYDLSATDPSYIHEMNSSDLYALNGQGDNQGPINYDIYAGFNRVISGPGDRVGSGVEKVKITILEKNSSSVRKSGNKSPSDGASKVKEVRKAELNIVPAPVSLNTPKDEAYIVRVDSIPAMGGVPSIPENISIFERIKQTFIYLFRSR